MVSVLWKAGLQRNGTIFYKNCPVASVSPVNIDIIRCTKRNVTSAFNPIERQSVINEALNRVYREEYVR